MSSAGLRRRGTAAQQLQQSQLLGGSTSDGRKDRSVLRAGSQQGPRTQREADVHLDVCELLRYLGTPPTLRTWRVLGGEFPEAPPNLTQLS